MSQSAQEGLQPEQGTVRILHILNGDSVRGTIERSGMPGTFSVWADALHDGPVPAGQSPEQFRETRAAFWAANDPRTLDELPADLHKRWDDGLASFPNYDEVVMWFEHDLYDQLILIHHLDFYSRQDLGGAQLSLICIGEYPGVEAFHGLGQLNAKQLRPLLETRRPVTRAQFELGRAAWAAFTSPDPTTIEKVILGDTSELPFLKSALIRFLEEYPSKRNGLPRTEGQILSALEDGPKTPMTLFRASSDMEESLYMGDTTFWRRVQDLASGPNPLVDLSIIERQEGLPAGEVRITNAGLDVLAGRADWVALNSIDRWLGGVHLHGPDEPWRWDETTGRLTYPS
ncbi:MAG TPA: DUF1835 domain-containing protein [Blastocatellia bacterium]|nr:DUF1835 domain-containing protein [Blastocatellia bacterium]